MQVIEHVQTNDRAELRGTALVRTREPVGSSNSYADNRETKEDS